MTPPVCFRLTPMVQPLVVWRVIWFPNVPALLASTTSISPFAGQLYASASHSAGHVPHPYGECRMSKMKRPSLYVFFDWIRIEFRPPMVLGYVVSTLMTAEVSVA